MSSFTNSKQSFYVARINKETGKEEVITQNNYNKLFNNVEGISSVPGYPEPRTANVIASALNTIDDELGQNHFYYVIRNDEVTRVVTQDIPEDFIQFFNGEEDPVPPSDGTEEGTTDGSTEEPTDGTTT